MNEPAAPSALAEEILVVEDNLASLKLLTNLLLEAGYRVRPASDGELALMSVAVRPPTLILLDIRMPGLDGFEVCQRLKADPAASAIPVLFLSARHDTEDKVRALQIGGVDYITKPFTAPEVVARVETHLKLHRLRQGLAEQVARRTRELVASEQRQRLIMETLGEGVYVVDRAGLCQMANPACARLLGYADPAQLLGRDMLCLQQQRPAGGQAATTACSVQLAMVEGRSVEVHEEWFWRVDGTPMPVEARVEPLWEEGRVSGAVVSFRDVSALRESEGRYRSLFEDSPISLREENFSGVRAYLADLRQQGVGDLRAHFAAHPQAVVECARRVTILRVNQSTLKLLEADDPQELQAGLPRLFTDGACQVFQEEVLQFAGGANRFEAEAQQRTLRGNTLWTRVTASLAPGADGAEWGRVLVSLVDVTAQKEAQAQLVGAKERAEAANHAKGAFLAAMSHEIRTPMNVVIGMGDVLLDSGLNEEQLGYVRKLQGAGANLLELINQILDLSKIEAGQLQIVDEPVELHALVGEVIDLLQVVATGKGLRLEWVVDPAAPAWILADRLRLRQVLFNLVGNAIKFTEQGRISVREQLDQPGMLHLVVEDTGIGIGVDHLEQIFDDFTQADAGIARRYGGTGLGLGIARRLVGLMGGRIWVESRPGRGSTFHVTLPLRPAPPPPSRPAVPPSPVGAGDRSLHILLAEDSEDNQLLIRTFLKDTPHQLEVAADGAAAVRLVQAGSFELVFMDVQMPGMDGYTATRLIRQWEGQTGRPPLPIVALTAHALEGEAARSQEAGCDLYLSKPIKKQRLLEVIRQVGTTAHRSIATIHHP